jgi:hypothetical protein
MERCPNVRLKMFVQPLLGEAFRRRHQASVLRGAHERRLLLAAVAVGAGQLDLLGERLVLVMPHLNGASHAGHSRPK